VHHRFPSLHPRKTPLSAPVSKNIEALFRVPDLRPDRMQLRGFFLLFFFFFFRRIPPIFQDEIPLRVLTGNRRSDKENFESVQKFVVLGGK
jgi:hypothetical protein